MKNINKLIAICAKWDWKNLNCNEKKLFLNGLKRNEVKWSKFDLKIELNCENWLKIITQKLKFEMCVVKIKSKLKWLIKKIILKKTNEILIIKPRIC